MKTIYALLTENCNLGCSYCDIKYGEEEWREDLFFSSLNKFKDDNIVLFGGEPTLYKSRLYKALDLYPNASISSNLIFCDQETLDRISDRYIATTFRLYSEELMKKWVSNIKYIVSKSNDPKKINILVTMDWFMLGYLTSVPLDFETVIDNFIIKNNIPIRFEPLVGYDTNKEYFKIYDMVLLKLLKNHFADSDRYLNLKELENFKKDCSEVFSLYPDGKLKQGCPHRIPINICNECLSCKNNDKCQPCRLQCFCSFPKNTYEAYCDYKKILK